MGPISKEMSWQVIKKSFSSFLLLFLVIANYVVYKTNIAPLMSEDLTQELKKYIGTLFVVAIAFVIQKIVGSTLEWYRENVAGKTSGELDDKLIPLVSRIIALVIWIIAFIIILPFYGVNINALVAAMGVGSLAIALAAQDSIANIIAGFLIMIDAPFQIGDKIKLPSGEVVKVLEIGVRRSHFFSEDKTVIIVPNIDLSKNKIVNYTYGEARAASAKS